MPAQSPSPGSLEKSEPTKLQPIQLPFTGDLKLAYASSLVITLLAAIASIAGLLYGTTLYKTEEMLLMKLPTDLFTLVVGLPLLLISMWLTRRGGLIGLLCWPGTLLFVLYIYLAYAIGVPFSALSLVYVALVALSTYTIIGLVASIDAEQVRQQLAGKVPEKPAGGILAGLAILFTLMNVSNIITTLKNQTSNYVLEYPLWLVDLAIITPAWLIGGVLLWKQESLGYVAGAGLLLQGSMLFFGAIFALAFPALYTGSLIDVAGIVFILATSLITLIPFVLFVHGIIKAEQPATVSTKALDLT